MERKLSYVHGASNVPLIGDTIGSYFDHVAERYAEREALVVRHQGIRWNYRELRERVDNLAAGFLGWGSARRSDRDLVAELCRMGADSVRYCQGGTGDGEH